MIGGVYGLGIYWLLVAEGKIILAIVVFACVCIAKREFDGRVSFWLAGCPGWMVWLVT